MSEEIDLLLRRRSVLARNLIEPGPGEEALADILRAGMRVPDHGKLAPWRFLVVRCSARRVLGRVLADAFRQANPQASEEAVAAQALIPAPVVIIVVSRIVVGRIPEWEQILSCGAVCQNLLVAATALGFSGQWLTQWYAYDAEVKRALGVEPEERIAGFVYLGSAAEPPRERERPDPGEIVREWQGVGDLRRIL